MERLSQETVDFNTGPQKSKKKLFIILSVIAVVVAVAAVVAILLISPVGENSNTAVQETSIEPDKGPDPDDIEEKLEAYRDRIENEEDQKKLADLYTEKASYLWDLTEIYDSQDYSSQILEDLNKAEEINPTVNTAYDLCLFYSTSENPAPTDYCKLARDRDPGLFDESDDNDGAG